MFKKQQIPYNLFFLFPFILWVVAGAVLSVMYSKEELFRMINGNHSGIADSVLYYATTMGEGEIIIPALLLIMILPQFRTWQYFFTALFCNIVPFLIQQSLKSYFAFPRPFAYFHNAYWIHYLYKWPYLSERSFPSGHSTGAFSFFCFVSLLLPPRYNKLGFVFFMLALSVCYSRVYLVAHFFEDVYIGSIIGSVSTVGVFYIMDKYQDFFFKRERAYT